jgi:hypothetical protein
MSAELALVARPVAPSCLRQEGGSWPTLQKATDPAQRRRLGMVAPVRAKIRRAYLQNNQS